MHGPGGEDRGQAKVLTKGKRTAGNTCEAVAVVNRGCQKSSEGERQSFEIKTKFLRGSTQAGLRKSDGGGDGHGIQGREPLTQHSGKFQVKAGLSLNCMASS